MKFWWCLKISPKAHQILDICTSALWSHGRNLSFGFWGDLKTPKFHSEINWPLGLKKSNLHVIRPFSNLLWRDRRKQIQPVTFPLCKYAHCTGRAIKHCYFWFYVPSKKFFLTIKCTSTDVIRQRELKSILDLFE